MTGYKSLMHIFQLERKVTSNFGTEKHEKTFNCYDISDAKKGKVRDVILRGELEMDIIHYVWRLECYLRLINIKITLILGKYCQNGTEMVWKAEYCTTVLGFHSQNFQITSKILTHGYKLGKHLESSYGQTLSLCQSLVKYRFKNMFLNKTRTRACTLI